jgi:hypothetical protein
MKQTQEEILKEIEEEKLKQKNKPEPKNLPVLFRGTKKTGVIKKSEYDSLKHICI